MKPYKWQESCLREWENESETGYIEAVTGSGKTFLAIFALQNLYVNTPDTITFVAVPRTALAYQWKQAFIKNGFRPEDISVRGGGRKEKQDNKVVIYVINTGRYELARALLNIQKTGRHVFLIADEYHHYYSKENRHIFDFVLSRDFRRHLYHYLGISATPHTVHIDETLKLATGRLFYRYGLEEALKDGVVSPFAIYNIEVGLSDDEFDEYDEITQKITRLLSLIARKYPFIKPGSDFFEYIISVKKIASEQDRNLVDGLSNLLFIRRDLIANAEQRTECTLKLFDMLDSTSRIIVFCERISQCDALYSSLEKRFPHIVAKYHSQMDIEVRKNNLLSFRKKTKRILIACKALDEGIDIPSADVGIFLSNTDSELQRIQRLGRLIRKTDGKDIADLYYIYVKNTIEYPVLLHRMPSFTHCIFLSFRDGKIENPEYNRLLRKALTSLASHSRPDSDQISAIYNAAMHGSIHHDYLTDETELNDKISNATSVAEKNYFIVARAIHRFISEERNLQN